MIDILLPVYNEESVLEKNSLILYHYLSSHLDDPWQIIIADNGSTDRTLDITEDLSKKLPGVQYLFIGKKGRGGALREALMNSEADVLVYMDIDLSTDLKHLNEVIHSIKKGTCISMGTRLDKRSTVMRSLFRETLSRGYNLLAKMILGTKISDLQCGFKAFDVEKVKTILPEVADNDWLFDTEILIVAERKGYRIDEIPIQWIEDKDSSVKIYNTIMLDLKGLMRLRKDRMRQLIKDKTSFSLKQIPPAYSYGSRTRPPGPEPSRPLPQPIRPHRRAADRAPQNDS